MPRTASKEPTVPTRKNVKRVALINPPYSTHLYTKERRLKSVTPPLGLLYLHAYCRASTNIKLFDGELYDSYNELITDIERFQPDIIGYTATTPTYPIAKKMAEHFSKRCFQIIGGTYATVADVEVAKHFDAVMRFEGEDALLEIIQGKDLHNVQGLTFIEGKSVVRTKDRPLRENLDALPFPSWDIIDFSKYQPSAHRSTGKQFAPIMTSRGCYYNCMYCSTKLINGPKVRFRSPENVHHEMKHLKEKFGITHFQIWDDTFTLDKKRLKQLCELFRQLGIIYICNTRPDCISEEDAKLLAESGCRNVFMGVESGDKTILKYYGRTTELSKTRNAFQICHKNSLKTTASYMIGAPMETEDSLRNTLRFAKSLKSDYVLFNILTPHKQTRLYYDALQHGLLEDYNVDIERYIEEPIGIPTIKNKSLDRIKLARWKMKLYRGYYMRSSYLWQQLLKARSIHDLTNIYNIIRTYAK